MIRQGRHDSIIKRLRSGNPSKDDLAEAVKALEEYRKGVLDIHLAASRNEGSAAEGCEWLLGIVTEEDI